MCLQLYDLLRNHKKEDGSLLCDSFIRVPKRRQEPGYYEVVSNPMDLLKVQQKIRTDEYRDMDEMANDILLMVKNAKAFYNVCLNILTVSEIIQVILYQWNFWF